MLEGLIHHPDGRKSFQAEWSDRQTSLLMELRAKNWRFTKIAPRVGKKPGACRQKWERENGRLTDAPT